MRNDDEEDFEGMPDYDTGRDPVDVFYDQDLEDDVGYFVDHDTDDEDQA